MDQSSLRALERIKKTELSIPNDVVVLLSRSKDTDANSYEVHPEAAMVHPDALRLTLFMAGKAGSSERDQREVTFTNNTFVVTRLLSGCNVLCTVTASSTHACVLY
eukprot:Lankesteria_metandrocarpae@DN6709_c0_g1_i1.p1